jgi:hypothetical protein
MLLLRLRSFVSTLVIDIANLTPLYSPILHSFSPFLKELVTMAMAALYLHPPRKLL